MPADGSAIALQSADLPWDEEGPKWTYGGQKPGFLVFPDPTAALNTVSSLD